MTPLQVLLTGCIDYAGMFPPSSLDLQTTVERYCSYREGPHEWALGTLLLPLGQVAEFSERWPEYARLWPVAVVLGHESGTELANRLRNGFTWPVASIECGPLSQGVIKGVARILPSSMNLYIEVDAEADLEKTIATIGVTGARAKIRTGGATPSAIPSTERIARFICCCVQHRVAFKATAGLHHAVRGMHPLTYEAGSAQARMHGFLNVLLASTLLGNGGTLGTAVDLLEESSLGSFQFSEEHVRWRHWNFGAQQLADTRRNMMLSFGSCSFTEPCEHLRAAGLIP